MSVDRVVLIDTIAAFGRSFGPTAFRVYHSSAWHYEGKGSLAVVYFQTMIL
jgi:hypothetical protein